MRTSWPLVIACLCLAALPAAADELLLPRRAGEGVKLVFDAAPPADGRLADALRLYVGGVDRCCEGRSPVAGRYRLDGRTIDFESVFPLITGQVYVAVTRSRSGGGIERTEFSIQPDQPPVAPEVTAIYPSGATLPANTLRFYVHFSTPMQPHGVGQFIRLVDEHGAQDDAAFVAFNQELWSEDRRRLTLLLDPGRIKRGVAQNIALGAPLEGGRRYAVVVDKRWPAAGDAQRMGQTFVKPFEVSAPLRQRPSTDAWQIAAPPRSSRDALQIRFDRPFDFELLHRLIEVRDDAGQPVAGEISVSGHETVWRFVPDRPWSQRRIHLIVDARLEDVAGNNFNDALDHPLHEAGQAAKADGRMSLLVMLR